MLLAALALPALMLAGLGLRARLAALVGLIALYLLFAAAATLAWNPRSWTEPGWQLSFAAVVGILAIGVPMSRALRRMSEDLVAPRGAPERRSRRDRAAAVLALLRVLA